MSCSLIGRCYVGVELTIEKTVIITGGSRGMGLGAARQLAEKGANVVIVARDQDKLHQAIEHIRVCRYPHLLCAIGVTNHKYSKVRRILRLSASSK